MLGKAVVEVKDFGALTELAGVHSCAGALVALLDQAVDAEQVSRQSWATWCELEDALVDSDRVRGELAKRAADRFYGRVEGLCETVAVMLHVRASDVVAVVVGEELRRHALRGL